jgi:hypothetical protein
MPGAGINTMKDAAAAAAPDNSARRTLGDHKIGCRLLLTADGTGAYCHGHLIAEYVGQQAGDRVSVQFRRHAASVAPAPPIRIVRLASRRPAITPRPRSKPASSRPASP